MPLDIDFERVFDASPNTYVLLTPDFRIVAANRAYVEGSGRSRDAVLGTSVLDLFGMAPVRVTGSMRLDMEQSLLRAVATRRPSTIAATGVSADAGAPQDRYFTISHVPVLDANGAITFILQHVVEVTDLSRVTIAEATPGYVPNAVTLLGRAREVQEANRALYAERVHLLRLFDEAPGLICFLRGEERRFELANRAFFSLIGERDLLGLPVMQGLPELAGQGLLELFDHVYSSGRPYRASGLQLLLQRRPEGALERIYLDLTLQPITERDGSVSGILLQGNDVTAQLEAELELHRHREHLEELVAERTRALQESEAERSRAQEALVQAQKLDALGKLTGGVAHDFNNVLQLIAGNLQLAMREQDPARRQGRLESALAAVDKGGRLAGQLLTFARRQPLVPQVVDLRDLLAEMRELLQQAVGPAVRLKLCLDVAESQVRLDPFQFETMLINLAVNARDAIQRRTGDVLPEGRVEIALGHQQVDAGAAILLPPGDYLTLRFQDNGCGMNAVVRQQAFEPFFSTKGAAGTGLGLSLVYGFVGQSGGDVELLSAEGMGTTVAIRLPLCRDEAARADAAALPVRDGRAAGETVLLLEPDASVRTITTELLLDLGYRVIACRSGDEAWLQLLEAARVDLLMTAASGRGTLSPAQLVQRARARCPALPVILVAADDEGSGLTSEAAVQLAKPFGSETLAVAIERALLCAKPPEATDASVSSPSPPQSPSAAAPTSSVTSGPRVLLVEDDDRLRELTAECLLALGCSVTSCASSSEALASTDSDFDLLFTDLNLSDGSGIELAKTLSARQPQLRVVLASGDGRLAGDGLARADLAHATFLAKPYDLKQLQELLTASVES